MKRVVIVTGASSGMGAEFARQLAASRRADEIWLVARRAERLKTLADKINGGKDAPAKVVAEAIRGATAYGMFSGLLRKAASQDGEGIVVDTLVNNAGFGTYGPFAETPPERQLEMVDLNVDALTAICAAVLPYLARGSRILNVASLAAYSPLGNFAVYAATKAYVLSLSTALAAELADRGIKVLALCPGPVSTEFASVASNGARKEVLSGKPADAVVRHALRRLDRGKHVAVMALEWKAKAFLSRFVGRYFFARHTYLHEKRPYNHED